MLQNFRLVLISLWLGAALFFSFVVAPVVFAVMRSTGASHPNHVAGTIVTRTLAIVNISGFLISLVMFACSFLYKRTTSQLALCAESISLGLLIVLTAIGQWIINPRLLAMRMAMRQYIDDVDRNDSLRISFNKLHTFSVAALGVGMLAAVIALMLISRRSRQP